MMDKQNQNGGDGSTNIQAENIVLNIGIDEKRAREIFHEMNLQLRREYTQEALEIANKRVSCFEIKLMDKIEKVDGALEAFTDPSFQLLILEAQKAAASTERPADYEILAELLIHRFKSGNDRKIRSGINRAVEIVDEISDDALLCLTVAHSASRFAPKTGDTNQALDVLNNLYKKLRINSLPIDFEWLDHAEILDTVRTNQFGAMKKIKDYYSEEFSGFIDVGIKKQSEAHRKAISILKNANLSEGFLVENIFNTDFLRIPIYNKNAIKNLVLRRHPTILGQPSFQESIISPEECKALEDIYNLYQIDEELKNKNIDLFMIEWDKRENLKKLRDWWDKIPTAFKITSVGRVLAHANAQRCDNNVPPLN